jgi:hypothetical protein
MPLPYRPRALAPPLRTQGLTLGTKISQCFAEVYHLATLCQYSSVTKHPSFGKRRDGSVLWKARGNSGTLQRAGNYPGRNTTNQPSHQMRKTYSHVYVGTRAIAQLISGIDCFEQRATRVEPEVLDESDNDADESGQRCGNSNRAKPPAGRRRRGTVA